MRLVLTVLGILLILTGGVWILQGIDILPGSFMTGQIEWALYGAIAALVGIALLWFSRRRSDRPKP